jgi:aerobic-type carbon monoxide dehydrogenase small subunit (CoxS/CutS family)
MEGNICRCGTYTRIVLAIRKVAEMLKGGAK